MSIFSPHLRRLLQIYQLTDRALLPILKRDIQSEGRPNEGRDFYMPFWRDAKLHAIGEVDLNIETTLRIEENRRRRNLYPRLKDGYLLWWNEKRRWSNQNCRLLKSKSLSGIYTTDELSVQVKVQNLMSLGIGEDDSRLIYPYFSHKPALDPQNARIGLWLLSQTLSQQQVSNIRILDVIRGKSFSTENHSLQGDEESLFLKHYKQILRRRQYLIENP